MTAVTGEQVEMFGNKRVATIGKRSREESAKTDTTCTPKYLTDRLPHRDLDPFSNERSTVKSTRWFILENGQNGLELAWLTENGEPCTAFQNHPFSDPMPFVSKAHYEMKIGRCVDLIVLCKDDTSTDWHEVLTTWYPDAPKGHVLSRPPEMWRFKTRVEYDEHPDVIEDRRLERLEEKRAKLIKQGLDEETITKRLAKVHGNSSANFCSVIYHFRGWREPDEVEKLFNQYLGLMPTFKRRPRLDLSDIATLWVQPIGRPTDEFVW